jgi:hypothetical protein
MIGSKEDKIGEARYHYAEATADAGDRSGRGCV